MMRSNGVQHECIKAPRGIELNVTKSSWDVLRMREEKVKVDDHSYFTEEIALAGLLSHNFSISKTSTCPLLHFQLDVADLVMLALYCSNFFVFHEYEYHLLYSQVDGPL